MAKLRSLWSKRFSLRLAECWLYAGSEFKKLFGVELPQQVIAFSNGYAKGYMDEKMLAECCAHLISEIKKQGIGQVFEREGKRELLSFRQFCKELSNPHALSNAALYARYEEFVKRERFWMAYLWYIFLLDEPITQEAHRLLAPIVPDPQQVVTQLSSLHLPTAVTNYQIAQHRKQNTAAYAFFHVLNMDEEELSLPASLPTVSFDANAYLGKITDNVKQYWDILAQHSGDKELYHVLEAVNKIAFYREFRNDIRQESYFYARQLVAEIAKRIGMPIGTLIWHYTEEIKALLAGETVTALPHERKSGYAITFSDGKIVTVNVPETHTSEKIHGQGSGKGTMEGKVCIIRHPQEDREKWRPGNVLVTATTNLGFFSMMSEAKAIITDDGGMLSHAAIVARELNLPFIVGTKCATAQLKNGDNVVLDFESGIVQKL